MSNTKRSLLAGCAFSAVAATSGHADNDGLTGPQHFDIMTTNRDIKHYVQIPVKEKVERKVSGCFENSMAQDSRLSSVKLKIEADDGMGNGNFPATYNVDAKGAIAIGDGKTFKFEVSDGPLELVPAVQIVIWGPHGFASNFTKVNLTAGAKLIKAFDNARGYKENGPVNQSTNPVLVAAGKLIGKEVGPCVTQARLRPESPAERRADRDAERRAEQQAIHGSSAGSN